MTPLPAILLDPAEKNNLIAWRLHQSQWRKSWQRGVGSQEVGGRWSLPGRAVVYAALDPATAILEVAVNSGFAALDANPYDLARIEILRPDLVHVVQPADLPNPRWLTANSPIPSQQRFGDHLLNEHPIIVIPSAVSTNSWNILIDVKSGAKAFKGRFHERFALDTRLAPIA